MLASCFPLGPTLVKFRNIFAIDISIHDVLSKLNDRW